MAVSTVITLGKLHRYHLFLDCKELKTLKICYVNPYLYIKRSEH